RRRHLCAHGRGRGRGRAVRAWHHPRGSRSVTGMPADRARRSRGGPRAAPTGSARKRVAAIDCGTNSIRLLIADLSLTPSGAYLVDVHREMRIVRLGERVDATGRLSAGALDRTWKALADYAAI